MPQFAPTSPQDWVFEAVARCWRGAWVNRIAPLAGDASTRRYWRVSIQSLAETGAPATAVMVDLGPNDLPRYARALAMVPEPPSEPPILNLHRYLAGIGVAVPAIYLADAQSRKLLVEDLGDLSLQALVTRDPASAPAFYRLALDELLKLHIGAAAYPDASCIAFSIAYDARLFGWEMEQFLAHGLAEVAPGAQGDELRPEIEELARLLGAIPRVLSHRDYHYGNLMVQQAGACQVLRVIDYQDALMAPAAQDLAVLFTTRNTGTVITPAIEQELLAYYLARARSHGAIAMDDAEFMRGYRWCVLQHALKVIGLFSYLDAHAKPGYKVYLPMALAQARRMLAQEPQFPALRRGLGVS